MENLWSGCLKRDNTKRDEKGGRGEGKSYTLIYSSEGE